MTITSDDKKVFTKRVVELVEQSLEEHESLLDGLPVEIVDWFYEYIDNKNEEKLRIAENYIYQPEDFEEYRKELKNRDLPDSTPPQHESTLKHR